jgi:predicted DCC family thiol-disulfide oxidoreductase YuxK
MAHLVLYDGVCGLCNRTVQAILRRDRAGEFRFASLQGDPGRRLLEKYGRSVDALDSVILLTEYGTASESLLGRMDAVLFIVKVTGGWWRIAAIIKILPRGLRDRLYAMIATRRYRWFGRLPACPLPEKRYLDRFLDRNGQR